MEGKSIDSPNLDSTFEPKFNDFKYICSLCASFVSQIQKVKDRVSQVELIFCKQLLPKFISISKAFQRKQEEWKKRETNLLSQNRELECSLVDITQERQKLLKEIKCKEESLVTEKSKTRDMQRDFDTLNESYNSLKSQNTDLIKKLEDSERAVEEKKVKPHSSKRSHEDLDEINMKETSPYTELRKQKLRLNSMSTSARSPPNCISDAASADMEKENNMTLEEEEAILLATPLKSRGQVKAKKASQPIPESDNEKMKKSQNNSISATDKKRRHGTRKKNKIQIDASVVPDELRCHKGAGSGWRCPKEAMPDSKYCTGHVRK